MVSSSSKTSWSAIQAGDFREWNSVESWFSIFKGKTKLFRNKFLFPFKPNFHIELSHIIREDVLHPYWDDNLTSSSDGIKMLNRHDDTRLGDMKTRKIVVCFLVAMFAMSMVSIITGKGPFQTIRASAYIKNCTAAYTPIHSTYWTYELAAGLPARIQTGIKMGLTLWADTPINHMSFTQVTQWQLRHILWIYVHLG